jgi:hypothetical protein
VADRGLAEGAHDQITLPVSWHGPVGDLGGPLADRHHVRDPAPPFMLAAAAMRLAQGSASTQIFREFLTKFASGLDEHRLVDGLVRHPHRLIIGEVQSQGPRDLLRAVPAAQPIVHFLSQPRVRPQLGRLRPGRPPLGPTLRHRRQILPITAAPVAADLPADRARITTEPASDLRLTQPGPQPDHDLLTFGMGQEPPGSLNQRQRAHPASIDEPQPPTLPGHARPGRRRLRRHALPDQRPKPSPNLSPMTKRPRSKHHLVHP